MAQTLDQMSDSEKPQDAANNTDTPTAAAFAASDVSPALEVVLGGGIAGDDTVPEESKGLEEEALGVDTAVEAAADQATIDVITED